MTPQEREEHVDLLVQLAHYVALLQSRRSAEDHNNQQDKIQFQHAANENYFNPQS